MTVQIVGKPTLRYTKSGEPMLTVSQNLAPRAKDKQTGQWDQVGLDQWTQGIIFAAREERDLNPEAIMSHCPEGWRVILSAEKIKRTEYRNQAGETKVQDELQWPTFIGYAPPAEMVRGSRASNPGPTASYQAPAGDDPWGGASTDFDTNPPF